MSSISSPISISVCGIRTGRSASAIGERRAGPGTAGDDHALRHVLVEAREHGAPRRTLSRAESGPRTNGLAAHCCAVGTGESVGACMATAASTVTTTPTPAAAQRGVVRPIRRTTASSCDPAHEHAAP